MSDWWVYEARCPMCSRFVKVSRVLVNRLSDQIIRVEAVCKRDGQVVTKDYWVWP